jgi:hypothetical protein
VGVAYISKCLAGLTPHFALIRAEGDLAIDHHHKARPTVVMPRLKCARTEVDHCLYEGELRRLRAEACATEIRHGGR